MVPLVDAAVLEGCGSLSIEGSSKVRGDGWVCSSAIVWGKKTFLCD
jgi:hypothetical protein